MRRVGRALGMAAALAWGLLASAAPVAAQGEVPERRAAYAADTDLPGGDLRAVFGTTLEACERLCLADAACTAFTFNTRNGSCFPKAAPGAAAAYRGALSARILPAAAGAAARATERRGDLSFLYPGDFEAARAQAAGLGRQHLVNGESPAALLAAARAAEAAGNADAARGLYGAAAVASDAPEAWAAYAEATRAAAARAGDRALAEAALSAFVNAYLRADGAGQRHAILAGMAGVLEPLGRGREAYRAVRLAQNVQRRDDTATAEDRLAALYGFRIEDHEVESDSARPRLCATFTEQLVEQGLDYTPYVQLPEPGLTVEPGGWRQLCVAGLAHGQRVSVTFRQGLPAADGQSLRRPVTIAAYVRDRTPAVRFPGRGYILPAAGTAALPVETVNATALSLTLYAVSDRNLIRSIQNDWFGAPMRAWSGEQFAQQAGEAIWTGTATVPMEVNRDITTRLPMAAALAGRPPGIYVLAARVPGGDDYERPPAWQWFVVSDLGITTLSATDGVHVVVRSLATAGPKAGATVALISRSNRELGRAVTDAQGLATFPPGLARGTGGAEPALVTVEDGGDIAFLSLTDPEFDLSDRGVAGREAAPPVDVFLATDRGAYRAGETVHATALARDGKAAAIEGLPLTAVIRRPDGVEYARQVLADRGGGYVLAQPIAASAPRGIWRVELFADTAARPLAAQTFLVEDFLPERIDVALTAPETPVAPGGAVPVTLAARYLFGAPGADLAIEGEAVLRAAEGLPQFPGYRFGRAGEAFAAVLQPLEGAPRTDAAGLADLALRLPALPADPGRPLEAVLRLRVAEGSGRPVERAIVRAVAPAAPLIGIRPETDGTVPEGGEAAFDLIAVGEGGARVALDLAWRLDRIETRYQWYQTYGDWMWEPLTTRTRVAEGRASPGTGDPARIAAGVDWGEYELTVWRADGAPGGSSLRFFAGWYAPADASRTPDVLDLSLDRPAYRPGDTARLRIVPRAAGTVLVSVLSNRLIALRAVEVPAGESTIELPVTDDWGAGAYVTATLLRPMDAAAGRLPARAIGLAHAAVDPGRRRLAVAVEAPAEADPRGPLPVAVRVEGVQPGETAHVTLAAVDVGILNLTAFAPPDPEGHYFGQRRLGVGIRDVYGRLIDGLTGAEGQVRSGGDGGNRNRLLAPPPTEELVAYFTGPVTVGDDGLARATFDLPPFNGTVRLMAVAWSRTGVGQASADVLVRDPVVVTASLPRFMAPGDDSRLLLEIVHATGPAGRMALDATAAGVTLGPVPGVVDLAEGGKALVSVPLRAGDPGLARLTVVLTTPDGRRLEKPLVLPIEANDPEIARTDRLTLAPGATFRFDRDVLAGLRPGTARATLAAGALALMDAPGLLAALDRYPYGCTEQIASRAMPLLYLSSVAEAAGLAAAADIDARIGQAARGILLNQTAEGGFGLWSAGYSGDLWLDSYATDFLSRARAQGHAVPDTAFRAALDNLRSRVNYAGEFETGGEDLAYALMVLAREGAAAVGDLRYFADVKGDAFATPLAAAQLGAALAFYGDQPRADAMFARAARLIDLDADAAQTWRADYGTALRDAAGVVALARGAGSAAVDVEAVTRAIAARTGGRALSTQEAAWMLLATHALIDRPEVAGLTLDGAPMQGLPVRVLGPGQGGAAVVANGGAAPVDLTLSAFGVPEAAVPAGGDGYAIARRWFTLDGNAADPARVRAGTRLVAVIDVTPYHNGEARLIVNDPLPAGFEIDNPNLIAAGQIGALDWLAAETEVQHAEFRQDRFIAAIDRQGPGPFSLAYIVRAVSPGTFRHPAPSVEDMYRPTFRGWGETGRVVVTE